MSNNDCIPQMKDGMKLSPWLIVILILVGIGFAWWQDSQIPQAIEPVPNADSQAASPVGLHDRQEARPDENEPLLPETMPEHEHGRHRVDHSKSEVERATASLEKDDDGLYQIENQSIRDLNGKIVFNGTIDLKPTIDRISRGESNRHRNDGTLFQNREGRLPRKPSGYYKEYVHPTVGENGPGPQRVIFGRDGEIWYTPDHYKTFIEVKSQKRLTR